VFFVYCVYKVNITAVRKKKLLKSFLIIKEYRQNLRRSTRCNKVPLESIVKEVSPATSGDWQSKLKSKGSSFVPGDDCSPSPSDSLDSESLELQQKNVGGHPGVAQRKKER